MDPLSDVLSLLKPRNYMFGGFDLGGAWSLKFDRYQGVKCYALVSGKGWLRMEGAPEPVHLHAGDCFLLPSGRPFQLASDLSLEPVDPRTLFQMPAKGAICSINGGGDCLSVGGHFAFTGDHSEILLGMLPPIVHIRKDADRAAMRWSIEEMMRELRDPRPGGFLVAQQLATTMLIQALRLHMADGPQGGIGWLFALADPQMHAAISCMHREPGYRWTIGELAKRAGMSRATFALRFKQTVGSAPMEHLTRWRMLLAADRLTSSSETVSSLTVSLGYESESAFSTAFKRVMGCSPRQHGRDRQEQQRTETFSPLGLAWNGYETNT